MRIVIAGGSGLIGRRLAERMLADGSAVDVLTRDPKSARKDLPDGARAVAWAGSKAARTPAALKPLANALDGADAVVNLSGAPVAPIPWTKGRRRTILDSRVGPTTAIVAAMATLPPDRRPKVLVNASGADIYTGRDATPADESTPPATDFLGDVCVRWEAAARAAEPLGVRVVLMRTAVVLGRGAMYTRIAALPYRLFVGGRLGSGRQWVSWIHLDDIVGLYREAVVNPSLTGPVNATAPEPILAADFATALGKALHRPNWFPTPAFLLRLVLRDESVLALGSRRVIPAKAESAGYVFRFPDLDAALAEVF
jgi:uncharacterized protein (TIGR01777 family)